MAVHLAMHLVGAGQFQTMGAVRAKEHRIGIAGVAAMQPGWPYWARSCIKIASVGAGPSQKVGAVETLRHQQNE